MDSLLDNLAGSIAYYYGSGKEHPWKKESKSDIERWIGDRGREIRKRVDRFPIGIHGLRCSVPFVAGLSISFAAPVIFSHCSFFLIATVILGFLIAGLGIYWHWWFQTQGRDRVISRKLEEVRRVDVLLHRAMLLTEAAHAWQVRLERYAIWRNGVKKEFMRDNPELDEQFHSRLVFIGQTLCREGERVRDAVELRKRIDVLPSSEHVLVLASPTEHLAELSTLGSSELNGDTLTAELSASLAYDDAVVQVERELGQLGGLLPDVFRGNR